MLNMLQRVVFSRTAEPEPADGPAQESAPAPATLQPAFAASASGPDLAALSPLERVPAPPVAATLPPAAARRVTPLAAATGLEWNHRLVLAPLALAVVLFGFAPQPLLELCSAWAHLLADAQWRF
jgi:hypothetical protein